MLLQAPPVQLREISSQEAAGDSLKGVDDLGDAESGWVFHEEVDVVCLAVELEELSR